MEKETEIFVKYSGLYYSIMKGDIDKVKKFCEEIKEDPRDLTVCEDSVLHMAIYMRREQVAREILELRKHDAGKLYAQNVYGDTILHEAAATNMTDFVKVLLETAPGLLSIANKNGEMPLFKAAHFGKTDMFQLLADKVKEQDPQKAKDHLTRTSDGATVLHITILAEFFDLALIIAENYPELREAKDGNRLIGLQLLSSNPSAFKSGSSLGYMKTLIYYCAPSEDTDSRDSTVSPYPMNLDASKDESNRSLLPPTCSVCVDFCSMVTSGLRKIKKLAWNCFGRGWPMMEGIWKEKKKHESALKLAKLLIKHDFSWETSSSKPDEVKISLVKPNPEIEEREGVHFPNQRQSPGAESSNREATTQASSEKREADNDSEDTSLLIATRNGIIEIVKEILTVYPQAVEHVNKSGRNILHVAIRHRQKKIFNRVIKMEIPLTRLVRSIDDEGYTILHYVGDMDAYTRGTLPGPALQLQEELFWFHMVREIILPHYAMHRSKHNETAEELFKKTHGNLLKEAQDWLKRTSESCSTVAVLIATAAFTAAYTVPGGPNQDTGIPILLNNTFFLVFTIMDVLSLASSLTSVVMFLSILTSPFQMQDFRYNLPRKLVLGFTFLFFSVAVTMLAFAATILLIINLRGRSTKLLVYMVVFLPVSIFALLQFPLFAALTALTYSLDVIGKAIRRLFRFSISKSTCKRD